MSTIKAESRRGVQASLASAPVVGVVRTATQQDAAEQAALLIEGGLELVEITFSCPGATDLVRQLIRQRGPSGPPWIGMGTVTSPERAHEAIDAGAEFVVTPNTCPATARVAVEAGVFLIVGALTPTEIVSARRAGADLVKVYPLPPVGGPKYLATVRLPLSDIPILAAGGFPPAEIPVYREAGARAFGIAAPAIVATSSKAREQVAVALALARGETPS